MVLRLARSTGVPTLRLVFVLSLLFRLLRLDLRSQNRSSFHRGLGRGRCVRSCLGGLETRLPRLRGRRHHRPR